MRSVVLGVATFLLLQASAGWTAEVWEEPSDPASAINNPYRYAWRLFVALNWPADPASCAADSTKKLGDPGSVVWEFWPERFETYLPGAKEPPSWDDACDDGPKILALSGQTVAVDEKFGDAVAPLFVEPGQEATTQADEEVRLNRSAYEFIRTNKLYSRNEQQRRAKAIKDAIAAGSPVPENEKVAFPVEAKEVKAHWVRLTSEADKARYHWATTGVGEAEIIWGLAALSFTTKDLPNWYWTTFEHVDNEKRWPNDPTLTGVMRFAGWSEKSVDRLACSQPPYDCNLIPTGLGLEGTKWENYRLRGIQVDFVTPTGNPTRLVNSKIEGTFEQRSMSCITCHALAATNTEGSSMPISILKAFGPTPDSRKGYVGAPEPTLFNDDILQLDFVWSLRHARWEQ